MDRSLDETIAERQRLPRGSRRGGAPPSRRRDPNSNNNYPRDGVRKSTRDDRTNLDNDWVHDRFEDDPDTTRRGYERPRERRDRRDDRREDEYEHDRDPPPAKIRVENLNYELTEDDIYDLFTRIAPVLDAKLRYDRAGRSDGIAFVTYQHVADARAAIRDFDGANAKGQPIRLTLLPPPRRDNPFDKVENPRSLFDRIEAPGGRDRRRSQSPIDEVEDDHGARRGPRRAPGPRDRRSDVTKPAPDGIDRYVPGQRGGRSSSHRGGGRRPGERRERSNRDGEGPRMANGRPRKTAEELDAEMDDYWGTSAAPQTENGITGVATTTTAPAGTNDIDMIE